MVTETITSDPEKTRTETATVNGQRATRTATGNRQRATRTATGNRQRATVGATRNEPARVLALVPEAYGGFGGIAQYNRDLMEALSQFATITILPRLVRSDVGELPSGVTQLPAPGSKLGYLWRTVVLRPWSLDPGPGQVGRQKAEGGRGTAFQAVEEDLGLRALDLGSEEVGSGQRATGNGQPSPATGHGQRATDFGNGPRATRVIFCGHLNLLPAAWLLKKRTGARLWLQVHGIDAWEPRGALVKRMLRSVDRVLSVSRYTKKRFLEWAPLAEDRVTVLPNTIDLEAYSPGPKPQDLVEKYNLEGKKVILTVGRLSASERYKGHDRVIRALAREVGRRKAEGGRDPDLGPWSLDPGPEEEPETRSQQPETRNQKPETRVVYVIVGDGDDRPRLEALADELGVANQVRFVGFVDQEGEGGSRKVEVGSGPRATGNGQQTAATGHDTDHVDPSSDVRRPTSENVQRLNWYRTADAFVMPSTGEGFGIVFLEALACGLPVVAGNRDGSTDALLDGKLGFLVDPDNEEELLAAIRKALELPKRVPEELDYFSKQQFARRVAALRET